MITKYNILIIIFSLATPLFAADWIVDKNTSHAADFRQVSDAVSDVSVVNNDTIYVVGAVGEYNAFNTSKKLNIYGPGHFLASNPQTQATLLSAKINGSATCSIGAEGSVLSGLHIEIVDINCSNIIITRNRIWRIDLSSVNDIIISQNFINIYNSGSDALQIQNSTAMVFNNWIANLYGGRNAIELDINSQVDFNNNVIQNSVIIYNSNFHNNILMELDGSNPGTFTSTNSVITHNLGDADQFGTADNNQEFVDMALIFIGSGSTDGKWQLAGGSLALGAGIGGIDCGMFGGNEPYVLSCMPPIPSIYSFSGNVTGTNTTGLPVNVKIKTHQ